MDATKDPTPSMDASHPEEHAGLLSRLFFLWIVPTMRKGLELGSELTASDLLPVRSGSRPEVLEASFGSEWDSECARAREKGSTPDMVVAVVRFYGHSMTKMAAASLLSTVLFLTIPVCARGIVAVIEDDGELWLGFAYVAGMGCCVVASSICQQYGWYISGMKAGDTPARPPYTSPSRPLLPAHPLSPPRMSCGPIPTDGS